MSELYDILYDVTLFDNQGRQADQITDLPLHRAEIYARENRPYCGGAYVTLAGKLPNFKAYRLGQPTLRPRPLSTRRPTPRMLDAMVKRFELDGDTDSADGIRQLIAG